MLTEPATNDGDAPRKPSRRFFSDEEKRVIPQESGQFGVSVSQVARKYGIVTGMLFRWRVQFGVAQKRAKLASVLLADDTPAARLLSALVEPPDGLSAFDVPDGRRVFAPEGSDLEAVRSAVIAQEMAR